MTWNQQTDEEILSRWEPLVGSVHESIIRSIPKWKQSPSLRNAGMMAVLQASRDFDGSRGSFSHYAWQKIRWAMLDELRMMEDAPRSKIKGIRENIDLDDLEDANQSDPATMAEWVDIIGLESLMEILKPKEKQVLMLIYFRGHKQAEVARLMGITQPRIWQIQNQALLRLRKRLKIDL